MTKRNLQLKPKEDFQFLSNAGFKYKGGGDTVVFAFMSSTKPGSHLSDEEIIGISRRIQDYIDGKSELSEQVYPAVRIFSQSEFDQSANGHVYKYLSHHTWNEYTKNGSFLLSSLQRFRDFEHQGDPAGDRFEGSCFCAHKSGQRDIISATISGFDAGIFSTTSSLDNSERMRSTFGERVIQIDVVPFAEELCKLSGGKGFQIRAVKYADLKIFRSELSPRFIHTFPPNITGNFAREIGAQVRSPSLFAKPSRFSLENEIRIAINFDKDFPYARPINSPRLMKHVKLLD